MQVNITMGNMLVMLYQQKYHTKFVKHIVFIIFWVVKQGFRTLLSGFRLILQEIRDIIKTKDGKDEVQKGDEGEDNDDEDHK